MNFCSQCGGALEWQVPEQDNRHRYVCTVCRYIHYQNPRIVVGSVPVVGDRLLLCRRAIVPRIGFWTLPAGYLENGETMVEAALRETWEEACARLVDVQLYRLYDIPRINQVYAFYRARLTSEDCAPGAESQEVRLFSEADIPWSELAFPVVDATLRDFFQDRSEGGDYPISHSAISWFKGTQKRGEKS